MSAYTIEGYQTLCRMIAKGVTTIEFNGERITYRSLADMLRVKRMMEAELGIDVRPGRPRQHYPVFRKD